MAHIRKITRANGNIKFHAEIVLKKHGEIVHRESKTFDKQKLAKDWATQREADLIKNSVYGTKERLPIRDIIQAYLDTYPPTGRSKRFDIQKLMTYDLARLNVYSLTSRDLIKHITWRNETCKPQTATNDLIWLKKVIETMKPVMGYEFDSSIIQSARQVLKSEKLIAKSDTRDRLPTYSELLALSKYLGKGEPCYEVMWFSIYSARRISETCRMEWADLNEAKRTCVIRDLKDPRKKGVTKVCKLPKQAFKVIMRQPRTNPRIFPYNSKTMTTYFANACKVLGIRDLHFHDFRHQATSWLFAQGLSIQHVQQVTLHSTWQSLAKYTHIDPSDVDI